MADITDTFVTLSLLDQRMERSPTSSPERHPSEPEAEHDLKPRAQSQGREPEGDESDAEEDVGFEGPADEPRDVSNGHEQDGEEWGAQEEAEENDQEDGKDVDAGDGIDQELLQSAAAKRGGVSKPPARSMPAIKPTRPQRTPRLAAKEKRPQAEDNIWTLKPAIPKKYDINDRV